MKHRFLFQTATAVACGLLLLAGCGDSNSTSSSGTGELSADQTAAVVDAVSIGIGEVLGNALEGNSKLAPTRSQIETTVNVDTDVNCPVSGMVNVDGSATGTFSGAGDPASVSINYEVTETFSDCATEGKDGNEYTINGSLTTTGSSSVTISQSQETVDGSANIDVVGVIGVEGEGLSVEGCQIDLEIDVDFEGGIGETDSVTGTATWQGSVCGTTMNGSLSVNI